MKYKPVKAHTTLPDRDLVDTDLVLSSYLLWKQDQVLGRDCQHDHQQENHGVLQGDPHRQALGGAHQRQGGCFFYQTGYQSQRIHTI